MNVMMLTAGEGTRLRPHTNHLPKPAIPFLTVPLYAYSLHFLKGISKDCVVMNTFHLAARLKSTVQSFNHTPRIQFSDEEKLMGSGGGVWMAAPRLKGKGDFILMNGDEIIIPTLAGQIENAIQQHTSSGDIATLLVTEHSDVGTKFGGVWVDQNLQILGFGKAKTPHATKGYHYIGVAIFSDGIFDYLPSGESNILYDGLVAAIKAGCSAGIFRFNCHWFETGNEADFKEATKECVGILSKKNNESEYLKELIQWRSPNSEIQNHGSKWVIADRGVSFNWDSMHGYNIFSEGVILNEKCVLKDCILGPHVQIKTSDHIENKLILSESDVS